MTNIIVQIILCLAAWAIVLVRFRAMYWQDARKDNAIALKVWLMMLFFALGLTGLTDLSAIFDAYTANNLSRLLAYCSFFIAINFGVTATFHAVGKDADRPLIRWLWFLLVVTIMVLGIIYILFLSRIPEFDYYKTPQSLPEAISKLIVHFFETIQGLTLSKMLLTYLPSETSAVMRARVKMILVGSFAIGMFWLVMIIIAAGYFWPVLAFPILIDFASVFVVFAMILHLVAFLHNNTYARFVLLSRSFEHWRAFQELQYLTQRMTQLFPPAGMPPGNPPFWQFLLDPEYYLHRAVILILDGRTMLNDFMTKARDSSLELQDWEIEGNFNLLGAAQEVDRALRNVDPPDDFFETVEAYRRASRAMFKDQGQKQGFA